MTADPKGRGLFIVDNSVSGDAVAATGQSNT